MRQADCHMHQGHSHQHGPGCGHRMVEHVDHADYLHDGHLHHVHDDHLDEHVLPISAANPAGCTPQHTCSGHGEGQVHGASCGHPRVPDWEHVDYLVNDHLHHVHGDHCDDHGRVVVRA
jgi:hypothetical protein